MIIKLTSNKENLSGRLKVTEGVYESLKKSSEDRSKWDEILKSVVGDLATTDIYWDYGTGYRLVDISPDDDTVNQVIERIESAGFKEVDRYIDYRYGRSDNYVVFTRESEETGRDIIAVILNAAKGFAYVSCGYSEGTEDDEYFEEPLKEQWNDTPDAVIDTKTPFHNAAVAKELGIPPEDLEWEIKPNGYSIDPDYKDYLMKDKKGNTYKVRVMGPRPQKHPKFKSSYNPSHNLDEESLNESINSDIVSMIKKQFPKATIKTSVRKHSDVHKSNPDTPIGKTKYVNIRITPDSESSVNSILQYCNHNIKKVLDSDNRFYYYGDVPARNPRGGKEVILSYDDYSDLSDDEYNSLLGESLKEDIQRIGYVEDNIDLLRRGYKEVLDDTIVNYQDELVDKVTKRFGVGNYGVATYTRSYGKLNAIYITEDQIFSIRYDPEDELLNTISAKAIQPYCSMDLSQTIIYLTGVLSLKVLNSMDPDDINKLATDRLNKGLIKYTLDKFPFVGKNITLRATIYKEEKCSAEDLLGLIKAPWIKQCSEFSFYDGWRNYYYNNLEDFIMKLVTSDRIDNPEEVIKTLNKSYDDEYFEESLKESKEAKQIRLSSIPGVTRDPSNDFTDDGHRFQAYLYKGVVPITYLRYKEDVYITIAFHHLDDVNYQEYKEFPSYKHAHEFNGVPVDTFNAEIFQKNLEDAYKDIVDFLAEPHEEGSAFKVVGKKYESKLKESRGDYVDTLGDVTDVYKDNDYEFNEFESLEEGTFSRVANKIRRATLDEHDPNNRKLYNFIDKFKKEFGIKSEVHNTGYSYLPDGDTEVRNYRMYLECDPEITKQFFIDGKAYKGLKPEYANRFTMNGASNYKANYEMSNGEIQVEIGIDRIYFDLHIIMDSAKAVKDRAKSAKRFDKAYKNESKSIKESKPCSTKLGESKNSLKIEIPKVLLYSDKRDLEDNDGSPLTDDQLISAGFKVKGNNVYLPSGTYDAEWFGGKGAPFGFSFKMKDGEWYDFLAEPHEEGSAFKVVGKKYESKLKESRSDTELLNEATTPQDYRVVTVGMDIAMPADRRLEDYGPIGQGNNGKLFKALTSALESVGLEMAGDYVDTLGDVTDVYKDNDYEFFE